MDVGINHSVQVVRTVLIWMRYVCAEVLRTQKLSHRSIHIQPRGLTNRANWCYVNAVSFMHTSVVFNCRCITLSFCYMKCVAYYTVFGFILS